MVSETLMEFADYSKIVVKRVSAAKSRVDTTTEINKKARAFRNTRMALEKPLEQDSRVRRCSFVVEFDGGNMPIIFVI